MKVSELTGKKLALWVGKAQKWRRLTHDYWVDENGTGVVVGRPYRPDVLGDQAFDLIEKFGVDPVPHVTVNGVIESWYAEARWPINASVKAIQSRTPQEAICRAVVASVYGGEVSDD